MAKKTGLVLFTLLFIMTLFSGCVISPRRNPDGSLANPTPTPTGTPTPTATPTPTPVPTPTPTPTPTAATGKLYVTSFVQSEIFQFSNAFTADGNVSPVATIAGVATTLSGPGTLTLDAAADRLYVPNNTGGSISIFDNASTANNNQAATRVITGPTTGLIKPEQVALDKAHDELYVADDQNVLVFANASTVNGDAPPAKTIFVQFTIKGMLLDTAADRLYLADGTGNTINIYDNASALTSPGPPIPSRQITGAAATLVAPASLQMDSKGRLLVSTSGSINVYPTVGGTIAGNLSPSVILTGSATGLIAPSQIVYDPAGGGTLYVADPGAVKVLVFTSFDTVGANQAPARAISGANTGLSSKGGNTGIALDTTR